METSSVRKKDTESRNLLIAIAIIGIGISLFQLYTSVFGSLLAHKQRLIHLSALMALGYLVHNRGRVWFSILVTAMLAAICVYTFANYSSMVMRVGKPEFMDVIIGFVYLALVLEGTRRTVGLPLVIIAMFFLFYCVAGPHMPGIFGHRGIQLQRLADHMFMSTEGIFGSPIGVSATYIYIFVLFGAFLEITKAGDLFIDLAVSVTGRSMGGPAKAAVFSSALMGTISGSSIANVVATGTFTIPLMKKCGYKPEFAGAVEAAASTGGQIMPPVMGAAAFMMIEYTRIPYTTIMFASLLPAVIYFLSVYISVHLEAKKRNLVGVRPEDMPDVKKVLRMRGHLLLPFFVMVIILVRGQTPMWAGFWATCAVIAAAMLFPSTRFKFSGILEGLEKGALGMVSVAMACATAGIVAGAISLTGIGLKMASYIEVISGGSLLISLFITMIACLILGMGLPTVATYVVLVTIVGPALTKVGVPVLAAHLFVFYFGVVADITPPVALAAYAASGIAGANQFKTGVIAVGIAAGGFLIPYVFVYAPSLLLSIDNGFLPGLWHSLPVFITACVGVYMLSASVIGYLRRPCKAFERILLCGGALCLIDPGHLTDAIGAGVLILVYALQSMHKRSLS